MKSIPRVSAQRSRRWAWDTHTHANTLQGCCGVSVQPPHSRRKSERSVCVALLMNPSGRDTPSAGQPLGRLAAITYSGNQSSRQPRNHSSRPVKSCRVFFVFFSPHSNTTPAATPWFLWVHLEVFHYGVCLYNKRLNQKSPKVTRVQ